MIGYIIIAIIIIIYALNRYTKYRVKRYKSQLEHIDFDKVQFNTGDIIFFSEDHRLYYSSKHDKSYFHPHFLINAIKTFWFQLQPLYTHAGIIVRIHNRPYLIHQTDHPQFDLYSREWVVGQTSLVDINEINYYKGDTYLHKYIGPPINVDIDLLDNMLGDRMILEGNWFKVAYNTILDIGDYQEGYGLCTDQVHRIMYYLQLTDKYQSKVDLNSLLNFAVQNDKYDNKQYLIENGWYKAVY